MNIDDAARATSSYFITRVDFDDFFVGTQDAHAGSFRTYAEAQAACDLMNLRAVLEAIRERTIEAHLAGAEILMKECFRPDVVSALVFKAVIDALLAEVGSGGQAS